MWEMAWLESKDLWKLSTPSYSLKVVKWSVYVKIFCIICTSATALSETSKLQVWTSVTNWVRVSCCLSWPLASLWQWYMSTFLKISCQTAETQIGQQRWGHMWLLELRISRNLSTLTVTMKSASHQRQGINRSELCLQQQQQQEVWNG